MSLGLEDGRIQDGAMSASSVYNNYHAAKLGRLNLEAKAGSVGAWCVKKNDAFQWLRIDLGGRTTVTKVATQGRQDVNQWVTSYAISYYPVKLSWEYVMTHGKEKVLRFILILKKVGFQKYTDGFSIDNSLYETRLQGIVVVLFIK